MPTFTQLSAPSGAILWALVGGQRLFLSVDRGERWSEQAMPSVGPNVSISFVDEREGWALGGFPPATQCQAQAISLAHTNDGARSWQIFTGTGIGTAQCKGGISFTSTSRGFISAGDPNTHPTIYVSVEGGHLWGGFRLPDPPGFTTQPGGNALTPDRVHALGQVLLVGASGTTPAGQREYVFRSTDDGVTWTFVSSVPAPSDIAFVTATRWLRLDVPDRSLETTDGGATWHPYVTDYDQAAPIPPQVEFGDASVGYATVRGGIQRTLDGGAHWKPIGTPGTF